MTATTVLQGDITTLRPITEDDAEITLTWRLGSRAHLMQRGSQTVEQQRAWIASRRQRDELNFIMEYRNLPVGMIALLDINRMHNSIQMGRLLIGEEGLVGKAPVGFEAELLLCDFAFDRLGMHKLYGDVVEDNQGMLKTRLYLGYKQDGFLRDHLNFYGVYKGVHALSLLEDEYRTRCRPKLLQLIEMMKKYSIDESERSSWGLSGAEK